MKFQYLRDKAFLAGWLLYGLNRWALKPRLHASETFFRGHFNDLLLIPCVLPPLLLLHRKLALRASDAPPSAREIALHLLVWSIYFELLGPLLLKSATGDLRDVLAYSTGGILCWAIWNRPKAAKPFLSAGFVKLSTDKLHHP